MSLASWFGFGRKVLGLNQQLDEFFSAVPAGTPQEQSRALVEKLKTYYKNKETVQSNVTALENYCNIALADNFANHDDVNASQPLLNCKFKDDDYILICTIILLLSQNPQSKKKALTEIMGHFLTSIESNYATAGHKAYDPIAQKMQHLSEVFSLAFDATPHLDQDFSEALINSLSRIHSFYNNFEDSLKKQPIKAFTIIMKNFQITSLIQKIDPNQNSDKHTTLLGKIIKFAFDLFYGKNSNKADKNYQLFETISTIAEEAQLAKAIIDNPQLFLKFTSSENPFSAEACASLAKKLQDKTKASSGKKIDKKILARFNSHILNLYARAIFTSGNTQPELEKDFIKFCLTLLQNDSYKKEIAETLFVLKEEFKNSLLSGFAEMLERHDDTITRKFYKLDINKLTSEKLKTKAEGLEALLSKLEKETEKQKLRTEIETLKAQEKEIRDKDDAFFAATGKSPLYSENAARNYHDLSKLMTEFIAAMPTGKLKLIWSVFPLYCLNRAKYFYGQMKTKDITKSHVINANNNDLEANINNALKDEVGSLLGQNDVERKDIFETLTYMVNIESFDITDPIYPSILNAWQAYNPEAYADYLFNVACTKASGIDWKKVTLENHFKAVNERILYHLEASENDKEPLISNNSELKRLWIDLIHDRSKESNYLELAQYYKEHAAKLMGSDAIQAYAISCLLLQWITDISDKCVIKTKVLGNSSVLGNPSAQYLLYQLYSESGEFGLNISKTDIPKKHHYLRMASAAFSTSQGDDLSKKMCGDEHNARLTLITNLENNRKNIKKALIKQVNTFKTSKPTKLAWEELLENNKTDNLLKLARHYSKLAENYGALEAKSKNKPKTTSAQAVAKKLYAVLKTITKPDAPEYQEIRTACDLFYSASNTIATKPEANLVTEVENYYANKQYLSAWKKIIRATPQTDNANKRLLISQLERLAKLYEQDEPQVSIRLRMHSTELYKNLLASEAGSTEEKLQYAQVKINLAKQYLNSPGIAKSAKIAAIYVREAADFLNDLKSNIPAHQLEKDALLNEIKAVVFQTVIGPFNQNNIADLKTLYAPYLSNTQRIHILDTIIMKTTHSLNFIQALSSKLDKLPSLDFTFKSLGGNYETLVNLFNTMNNTFVDFLKNANGYYQGLDLSKNHIPATSITLDFAPLTNFLLTPHILEDSSIYDPLNQLAECFVQYAITPPNFNSNLLKLSGIWDSIKLLFGTSAENIWKQYQTNVTVLNPSLATIKLFNDYSETPLKAFNNTVQYNILKSYPLLKSHPFVKFHMTDYFSNNELFLFNDVFNNAAKNFEAWQTAYQRDHNKTPAKKESKVAYREFFKTELGKDNNPLLKTSLALLTLLENRDENKTLRHMAFEQLFEDGLTNNNNPAVIVMFLDLFLKPGHGFTLDQARLNGLIQYFTAYDFTRGAPIAAQLFLNFVAKVASHPDYQSMIDATLNGSITTIINNLPIDKKVKESTLKLLANHEAAFNPTFEIPKEFSTMISKLDEELKAKHDRSTLLDIAVHHELFSKIKVQDKTYAELLLTMIHQGNTRERVPKTDLKKITFLNHFYSLKLARPLQTLTILHSYTDARNARTNAIKTTLAYYEKLINGEYTFVIENENDLGDLIYIASPNTFDPNDIDQDEPKAYFDPSDKDKACDLIEQFLSSRMNQSGMKELHQHYSNLKDFWLRYTNEYFTDREAAFKNFQELLHEPVKLPVHSSPLTDKKIDDVISLLSSSTSLLKTQSFELLQQQIIVKLIQYPKESIEYKHYQNQYSVIDALSKAEHVTEEDIATFRLSMTKPLDVPISSDADAKLTESINKITNDAGKTYIDHVSELFYSFQALPQLEKQQKALGFFSKKSKSALTMQIAMHKLNIETKLELILFKYRDISHINHLIQKHLSSDDKQQKDCLDLITAFCKVPEKAGAAKHHSLVVPPPRP